MVIPKQFLSLHPNKNKSPQMLLPVKIVFHLAAMPVLFIPYLFKGIVQHYRDLETSNS